MEGIILCIIIGDEHQLIGHYLIPVDPWQYRVKIEVLVIDIHHMINLYKDSVLKGWKKRIVNKIPPPP